MVRRITLRGDADVGWVADQALVDQRWTIIGLKGPVRGVTGKRDVPRRRPKNVTASTARQLPWTGTPSRSPRHAFRWRPHRADSPFEVLNGINGISVRWDDPRRLRGAVEAMRRPRTAAIPIKSCKDYDPGRSGPARCAHGPMRSSRSQAIDRRRHHRRRLRWTS